ncbi:MAG: hypothetical protein K6T61_04890 [Bryobacteraceae bacterium]|nr:hypothetical protein [Bryobacteraceae bacterium]
MFKNILKLSVFLAGVSWLGAVHTLTWRQSAAEDFEKGTIDKLSLRSDGLLRLAPAVRQILDSPLPYFWCLVEDSKGNVYAGGGGPGAPAARIYRVAPDGNSQVAAELEGLEVRALAVDRQDRLYAATSPDGKVYRITADGKPELFYDPQAKYIWAMAFDTKGNLYVATGDQGLIHRVTADGRGAVFFRTEEAHARSLALDAAGNLIVGTEPGGLVFRITPAGEGLVLYQTPKREVTAVAVSRDGAVYAAGVGNRQPAPPPAPPPAQQPAPPPSLAAGGQVTVQLQPAQPTAAAPPPATAQPPVAIAGGSEIYRIEPDGYAHRVWSHAQDIVYSLAFDAQGLPLAATGNKGVLYRIDSSVLYTTLVKVSPTQVTALCAGRQGRLYAATGNIGKVFQIGPGLEPQGSIESEVFDAGLFSAWGRLMYRGEEHGGGVRFETRSGNLDRPRGGWSPWAAVPLSAEGGRVPSPAARFLQYRLTLSTSSAGTSPEVAAVWVAYLARNAAPEVETVEITPANYRFPPQSLTLTPSRTLTLQPLGRGRRTTPAPAASDSGSVTMQYEKGQIGARWAANDPNGDELVFKVEIRGVQETEWKLVRDKVKERRLSWDSTAYADGWYLLRITASDAPDNPAGQELTGSLVSAPFLIDNSAPEIRNLTASRSGGKATVRWSARDAASLIQRAEYSLDGGEWLLVLPTTRLSDSAEHDYVLELPALAAGERTIAVRVTDDYDNQAVAKVVIR